LNKDEKIRVRFAPSPTGYLHVGGARTALYNWLFARRTNGTFVLRIEDTDADRSRPELVTAILESMKWLGLDWDEGPYYQSERIGRYQELARRIEKSGAAYPCFCTVEELQERRERARAEGKPPKYDGRCRNLSDAERQTYLAEGRPAALRFKAPLTGQTVFEDRVFGEISLQNSELEDFVLLRSSGQPTYHMGVVADDLDMHITHVVRGADHISNTPKQILLYQALGEQPPIFAHLPLILGPDRQRLSKRHGATAVGAYREQGILPEALVNFLALLGWTPPGQVEILSLHEMAQSFELDAVSKSNAVFNVEKLAWMNSEYLRNLPAARLLPLVQAELESTGLWKSAFAAEGRAGFEQCVALLSKRARTLKDFSGSGKAFFTSDFEYDEAAAAKFWKEEALAGLLAGLADRLAGLEAFSLEGTEATLRGYAERQGVKPGLLINAARVALTGQGVAPGLFEVMMALGREEVIARLKRAAQSIANRFAAPAGM
jgi:glutamyl-tRNA synthetase